MRTLGPVQQNLTVPRDPLSSIKVQAIGKQLKSMHTQRV